MTQKVDAMTLRGIIGDVSAHRPKDGPFNHEENLNQRQS